MLYETLNQPTIIFFLFLIGFSCGFLFDLKSYIVFLCRENKIVKIIFDFIFSIFVFSIFYLSVLKLDYGELRLFHFIIFFGSILLQRLTLGKLIAKLFNWCYTKFTNLTKKIQTIGWKKCKKEKQNSSKQQ